MQIETKQDILSVLHMPAEEFESSIIPLAQATYKAHLGDVLTASAMLGYTNVCKNQCLYCGMRAGNSGLPRYRIAPADVIETARLARADGFSRIFLVAGEDPKYGFDTLLEITSALHGMGFWVSLASGEFEPTQYQELHAAGADEYVCKFEMSDPETFNRLNPSTNFSRRMASIAAIQNSGMALASGNIVDYPGQTLEMLADDILLMRDLHISWAPVIPYSPAANTPLAENAKPGSYLLNRKQIAILRLMMPDIRITAQQPGKDLKKGLADEEGNLAAIEAGANLLFCDLLPEAQAKNFRVIDERNITGTARLFRVAELAGMRLER